MMIAILPLIWLAAVAENFINAGRAWVFLARLHACMHACTATTNEGEGAHLFSDAE
jgi:hypothetical protein